MVVNIQLLDNRPLQAGLISNGRARRHLHFDQLGKRTFSAWDICRALGQEVNRQFA